MVKCGHNLFLFFFCEMRTTFKLASWYTKEKINLSATTDKHAYKT